LNVWRLANAVSRESDGSYTPVAFKTREQDVVKAILDYLTLRHIPHVHVRNSGNIIHKKDGSMFFGKGLNQKGVCDIVAVFKSVALGIEVKSDIGRLRPEQKEWLGEWEKHGGQWILARSVTDVEQLLENIK
jgi:hypothetical protein